MRFVDYTALYGVAPLCSHQVREVGVYGKSLQT